MVSFSTFVREAAQTDASVVTYHVTATKNVPSILRTGLRPHVGIHSFKSGDMQPAIYVFPSRKALHVARHWIRAYFPDNLTLLQVTVPSSWVMRSQADWERLILKPVPPSHITNLGPYRP